MPNAYQENADYFRSAYERHKYPWSKEPCIIIDQFLDILIAQSNINSMLDIGCGEGANVRMAAHKGLYAIGLDREPLAIKAAKEASVGENLSGKTFFFVSDALVLPFVKHTFDVILDHGCFHHLKKSDQYKYLDNIRFVLRPRGYFILEVFSNKHGGYGIIPKRNWHIKQGAYRRFFAKDDIQKFLGDDFKILTFHEKKDEIVGDWHILARMKS